MIPLPHVVVESTDIKFVTPMLIAHDPLILIRVVQSLHSGVTLVAHQPFWTLVPAKPIDQSLTIFWGILKELRWSSEVSCVMGIVAAL